MILSVASGKGGTGKTTVATNLATVVEPAACYADCDVEAPNGGIFLRPLIEEHRPVHVPVPRVDLARCTFCGKCSEACRFNALAVLPESVLVFDELCHGCGGCQLACPEGAIREEPRKIGEVEQGRSEGVTVIQGRLAVGEAMSPPLIRAVRDLLPSSGPVIIDAPPGTSCPAMAAVQGTDACLLVTEPTPFGLHDLKLAVEMVRALDLPFGVVINRDGAGDHRVDRFCEAERIPVLARIPDSRRLAEAYSRGQLAVRELPGLTATFQDLWREALALAGPHDREERQCAN